MSRKRRYSRDHFDKTVVSILKTKFPDDRPPRFISKIERQPKMDLSLGIWRKNIKIQKNKIKNYIESIELICRAAVKVKQRKSSCSSFSEWQRKGGFKKIQKKSSVEILSILLAEENQDDNFESVFRKGSLNCLTPKYKDEQNFFRTSTFQNPTKDLLQVKPTDLDNEQSDQIKFGSRRRLESKEGNSKSREPREEDPQLKFPSLRKDSRATTDSNIAGLSRFSCKESTTISENNDLPEIFSSQSNKRSRRALALQECENIEVAETEYKMTFGTKTIPQESNQVEGSVSNTINKPQIKVTFTEDRQEQEDKPLNKRLQGVKKMLIEEGASSVVSSFYLEKRKFAWRWGIASWF